MPPPPPHILGYPSMAPPSYAAAIADAPPAYEDHVDEHNEDQDDYDHSTFSGSAYVPVYTYARPHQVWRRIQNPVKHLRWRVSRKSKTLHLRCLTRF